MVYTTAWLDSVQEQGEDNMTDSNADRHLFKVLGGLGSDVKHILASQERGRQDVQQLRLEVQQEMHTLNVRIDKELADLNGRVSKLETFNTKMLTVVAIVLPVAIFIGQLLAPWLLALL